MSLFTFLVFLSLKYASKIVFTQGVSYPLKNSSHNNAFFSVLIYPSTETFLNLEFGYSPMRL